MNSIIEIADSLINTVKESGDFESVKFLKAYNEKDYNPSHEGITAVVDLDTIEKGNSYISGLFKFDTVGEVYLADLTLRVYAGDSVSGDSLTCECIRLKDAVLSADSEGYIVKSKISPIRYESTTAAVYREITFEIEYVLCEAAV